MKCEFCHKEILPGTEVIAEGHSFCNSLHRYYWENGMVYDGSKFTTTGESNSQLQMTNSENSGHNDSDGKLYDKTKPMTLGDIFSSSFELIGKTFTRNIVIAALFLIPAGILFAYGIESLYSSFSGLVNHSTQNDMDIDRLTLLFKGMGLYFAALLVFGLGYQAAVIGITKIGCSAINGEQISLKETFKKIFSVTYFQSLGQILLITMTVAAFGLAVIIIIALINIGDFVMFKFVGVLLIIAGVIFLIYLIFRWYFVLIALVNDELGVIDTFSKSSFLIKGYWWRTFGIIILISIAVNFAISLISTPVSFGLMWGHMSQYFKMIGGNEQALKNPELLSGFMKSYFSAISILIILSNFFELLITPLFKIVIYYDLKIRKNDIIESSGEESNPLNPELSV
jgi:hypothetical protein